MPVKQLFPIYNYRFLGNCETRDDRSQFWNEMWIPQHFRRTLISLRRYEAYKSYAMSGFKLRKYS